jgi:two-component system, NarL family, sensor kinase
MNGTRSRPSSLSAPAPAPAPALELIELRARLAEAEDTLRAIRTGEVDAVVVAGKQGAQVFTLEGAEHAYRVLIESMNEGALTLTAGQVILYANQCFARMVQCPLEQVTGSSLSRFISAEDRDTLRALLKRADQAGSKIQVRLRARNGSRLPAQLSFRVVARSGLKRATIGMVVTDMTEARRNEEMLRALSHRLVQAQEVERGRVALELHDQITQNICAVLIRFEVLVNKLSAREGPSKAEAMKIREMLGDAADEVDRISRNLRPSALEHLGLVAVLRSTSAEFAKRTSVPVKLSCLRWTTRLPADTQLMLYRILQEALRNVEKHAHARHVRVGLGRQGAFVRLVIHDDGIGFDPEHHRARPNGKGGLGLLGMRERASCVGGTLKVTSARRTGTEIDVRVPLAAIAPSA